MSVVGWVPGQLRASRTHGGTFPSPPQTHHTQTHTHTQSHTGKHLPARMQTHTHTHTNTQADIEKHTDMNTQVSISEFPSKHITYTERQIHRHTHMNRHTDVHTDTKPHRNTHTLLAQNSNFLSLNIQNDRNKARKLPRVLSYEQREKSKSVSPQFRSLS